MSESANKAGDNLNVPPEFTLVTDETPANTKADAPTTTDQGWQIARELMETVVLSLIIFFVIRLGVQNYRIESHSMDPNFAENQFVLVNKLSYRFGEPQRGDVVVFHNPNNTHEDYIKRVVGLPGDTLELVDGNVYVNGSLLEEPLITKRVPRSRPEPPQARREFTASKSCSSFAQTRLSESFQADMKLLREKATASSSGTSPGIALESKSVFTMAISIDLTINPACAVPASNNAPIPITQPRPNFIFSPFLVCQRPAAENSLQPTLVPRQRSQDSHHPALSCTGAHFRAGFRPDCDLHPAAL